MAEVEDRAVPIGHRIGGSSESGACRDRKRRVPRHGLACAFLRSDRPTYVQEENSE